MDAPPVLHVSTMGNLANQMIQYMVALTIASRIGRPSVLSHVDLPMWGIHHPYVTGDFPATEIVTADRVPVARLAAALREGGLQKVDIRTYGQQMDNFLPPSVYAHYFKYRGEPVAGGGPEDLVCNIRQGDILDARHPDYVLIPAEFYADLAAATGLRLIFMGQTEDSPYMAHLRVRFPKARFLPSRGVAADFECMRRSRNIVPSISTFGWLAAWLGEAERIFLPVLGLFHPRQSRGTNLLPLDDPRFEFHLFPVSYAVKVGDFAAAHAAMDGLWRMVPPAKLAEMLAPRAFPPRDRAAYLSLFDEAFYRAAYPDIDQAVAAGHLPSGRHHFELYGFAEGRDSFPIDRPFYAQNYPIAAIELSQGDYPDVAEHWLQIGRARGYRRAAAP